jgi:hypothetical protein
LALKRFAHEFSRSSVISPPDIAVNTVALKEEVGRMTSMADCGEITGFMVELNEFKLFVMHYITFRITP